MKKNTHTTWKKGQESIYCIADVRKTIEQNENVFIYNIYIPLQSEKSFL